MKQINKQDELNKINLDEESVSESADTSILTEANDEHSILNLRGFALNKFWRLS